MRRRTNYKYVIFLILFLGVGYAFITTSLKINANIIFKQNTWDVHFEGVQVLESTIENSTATINNNDDTSINFGGNFRKPGEIFKFSVYVVNSGTVVASLDEIKFTGISSEVENYFTYSATYYDGSQINNGDELTAGGAVKLIVYLEYKYDVDDFVPIENLNVTLSVKYVTAQDAENRVWNYDFVDMAQNFVAPYTGTYKIELWGAQGGGSDGGKGAYVSGNLALTKDDLLYVYVGQRNNFTSGACHKTNDNVAFNNYVEGSCATGGGATDVRLYKTTNWYDSESLASRIIVAGAGGGAIYSGTGGYGGELIGGDGVGLSPYQININFHVGEGATQTKESFRLDLFGTTLGGGGYYFGQSGYGGNAGGGSSFISGYNGCIAITSQNDLTPICEEVENQDIACSYHYSGYKFTDGLMIGGNKQMTSPTGTSETGHSGNGYARITLISQ